MKVSKNRNLLLHCIIMFFFLVFNACNESEQIDSLKIENTTDNSIKEVIDYSKSNFLSNFQNDSICKRFMMQPLWDQVDIAYQGIDTLYLYMPIMVNKTSEKDFYLFVYNIGTTIRFNIVGIPRNYWDYILQIQSGKIMLRSDINGGWLPSVDVIGDLCQRMSHVCSDPYDERFLNLLYQRWLAGVKEDAMEGWSSSPLGNEYPWDELTDEEKKFVREHPIAAKNFYDNSVIAAKAVKDLPGIHNGVGDAVRHAYWSALNARDQGNKLANEFGIIHENKIDQPFAEKVMDLYNNFKGYGIGDMARLHNWSDERVYQEVLNAKDKGELQLSLY